MADNLVVVESPGKAKTIKKYLGKGFDVLASYGHVRDLVPKEGAVDPQRGYTMKYQVLEKNERHVDAIAKALRKSKALYLATDPDREGEAIAWHLKELLASRGDLEGKLIHRIVFHEITRGAIQEAVAQPRGLSLDLVNAQQARRALDYLVGFNLSPLLWKKIHKGLSAGRVQSPALRMICEREAEIQAFLPQEYWTIEGEGEHSAQSFPLKLIEFQGQKVEQFSFVNDTSARGAERAIHAAALHTAGPGASTGQLVVLSIDRKQRRRNPAPPFTTSTLQQEASRKLGFNARRTMQLAQQLYEGVDLGEGNVGLITYMRTDSVNLANEAITEIRAVATKLYGKEAVAEEPRIYKTKSKNAQEAHEAIRPTSAAITPADVESKMTHVKGHDREALAKLYGLIWRRAVASQMAHALFDTVAVDMLAGPDGPQRHLLRANGSTLVMPGFMSVYLEGSDDSKTDGKGEQEDSMLPAMQEGDRVNLAALHADQHFTEPPPRYTDASLVKALEEHGIGRPSTYASIISTLQDRQYVEMSGRAFVPTDIGKIVNRFLTHHFHRYVEYGFTAAMEDELDAVSRGEEAWTSPLEKFWRPFIDLVEHTEKNVSREEVAQAREIGRDPESGKPVSVRMGRYGPFVQIGTKDDEEKPRFAGLRKGQKIDVITLEQALALFALPRTLGTSADGHVITARVGPFGPYLQYGEKRASLNQKDPAEDPYDVTLERALEVIRLKEEKDANRIVHDFGVEGIQILNGQWGPYISNGTLNAKIPKERDPKSLTLEDCRELIATTGKPRRGGFGRFRRGAKGAPQKTAKPAAANAAPTAGKPAATASKPAAKAGAKASTARKKAPAAPVAPVATVENGRAAAAGKRPAKPAAAAAGHAGRGPASPKARGAASSRARKPAAAKAAGFARGREAK